MKKIIINMLLSVCFIHLHAQTGLPYKSLSDFKNDTTAFINYNFIDRAEQYKGKTLELIIRDLQIPVRYTVMNFIDFDDNIDGLDMNFYSYEEVDRLRESTTNKPYAIGVNWIKKVPFEDYIGLIKSKDYNKIINNYKDFQIWKIDVKYPPKSEHEQSKPKLRSTEEEYKPIQLEDGSVIFPIYD